jgi:hypothetical protein
MLRLGVVIYLISVTAAGPWVCCCTATRLAAHLLASSSAAPAPRPASECCCCHHDQAEQPDSSPAQPHPPGSPCPCRDAGGTVASAAAPSADRIAPDHLSQAHTLLPAFFPCAGAPQANSALEPALPFWTSGDLIHVCHHLRC